MHLLLAGDFKSFAFMEEYDFDYDRTQIYSADIMEVVLEGCDPVLFAAVGHTKVEIAKNLLKILETYPIDRMILMGNCGLIDEERGNIGDIAISSQVFQHDLLFRAIGYKRGEFPVGEGRSSFVKADRELAHLAKRAAKANRFHSMTGLYASGDQFVAGDKKAHYLHKRFNALFADSESAALSEIAKDFCYPFVVVKGVSNKVSSSAGEEFKKNERYANCRSGRVVMSMLYSM